MEIIQYRYSGFSIRATAAWNSENSSILTSEGKDRFEANFTRAAWVRVEGDAGGGDKKAGVILMGHSANHSHPEFLRTWDRQHKGAVFINFNPVQKASWFFEPGESYMRRYRVFVYDGAISEEEADGLWRKYNEE